MCRALLPSTVVLGRIACEVLGPQPGIKLAPPAVAVGSFTTEPTSGVYSDSHLGTRMRAWRNMNTGDKDTVIRGKERTLLWEGEVFCFFQFYVTGC